MHKGTGKTVTLKRVKNIKCMKMRGATKVASLIFDVKAEKSRKIKEF